MFGGLTKLQTDSNLWKPLAVVLDGQGLGVWVSAGLVSNISIESRGWSHYNSHNLNEWDVWYDGSGAFYLQYSAVPEPSTYMMVTGLLMVPGMSYVRRLRRKKNGDLETDK